MDDFGMDAIGGGGACGQGAVTATGGLVEQGARVDAVSRPDFHGDEGGRGEASVNSCSVRAPAMQPVSVFPAARVSG